MAITIVSAIAIYYFKFILDDESKSTLALPILIVTALVFIPVSVILSKKTGKKFVYGAGFVHRRRSWSSSSSVTCSTSASPWA